MLYKKILIALMLILVCLLINPWANQISEEAKQIEPVEVQKELIIEEVLNEVPKKYGVNPVIVQKVAFCESSYRYNVYGDGGHAYGVLQFHKPTFEQFEKKYGEELNYDSSLDQTKLASQMIRDGYGSHWTCYRKIKSV